MDIHRKPEAAELQAQLTGPAPSLTLVLGPEGAGKGAVVRAALRPVTAVHYRALPLPDADQRALFVERLGAWRAASPGGTAAERRAAPSAAASRPASPPGAPPGRPAAPAASPAGAPAAADLPATADWPAIFDHLLARAEERSGTLRLVLSDLQAMLDARPKLLGELERFWAGVRAKGLPVHLALVGTEGPALDPLTSDEGPFPAWTSRVIRVGPLTFREVGALFPSYSAKDRFLAWAIFGGLARDLRPLDPDATLATNVRQTILTPDAPLFLEGTERLQRRLQNPARYASLLRSMAEGRAEWGRILAGAPELGSGGQMAPYLARLQELGVVSGEASLDARPRSRSRRYRIADPFLWFWHRFVLPSVSDLTEGRAAGVWRRSIHPRLDDYAALLFPIACRDYLRHYADERLAGTARELGGLWGADHDVELAGTLRTGAAFYGRALWARGRVPEAADDRLQAEIGTTRYGFGKEARLRLFFSTDGFSSALLRRAARSDQVRLVGLDDMLGLLRSANAD